MWRLPEIPATSIAVILVLYGAGLMLFGLTLSRWENGRPPAALPAIYREKIELAHDTLPAPALVQNAIFRYAPEAELDNVTCHPCTQSMTVLTFSESVLKKYSVDELTGILAHEFAHAKTGLQNDEHIRVDIQAAQWTSPEIMLTILAHMRRNTENFILRHRWGFIIYPFMRSHLDWSLVQLQIRAAALQPKQLLKNTP